MVEEFKDSCEQGASLVSIEGELPYHPLFLVGHDEGYFGNLTKEENEALEALKTQCKEAELPIDKWLLKPVETTNLLLLRFLRARKFSVEKAFEMLEKDLAWREAQDLKGLVQQTQEEIVGCSLKGTEGFYPMHWMQGFDKQGRPVVYQKYGDIRIWECLKITTLDRMLRQHIWCNEHALRAAAEQSTHLGYNIETTIGVIDLEGWNVGLIHKNAYKLCKMIAETDSDHYPERLGQMVLINSPPTMTFAWKVISTWLDARTKAKIQILGGRNSYLPVLLDSIDQDQIPEAYGGTAPLGNAFLDVSGSNSSVSGVPTETANLEESAPSSNSLIDDLQKETSVEKQVLQEESGPTDECDDLEKETTVDEQVLQEESNPTDECESKKKVPNSCISSGKIIAASVAGGFLGSLLAGPFGLVVGATGGGAAVVYGQNRGNEGTPQFSKDQKVFWMKEQGAAPECCTVSNVMYDQETRTHVYTLTLSNGAIVESDGSDLIEGFFHPPVFESPHPSLVADLEVFPEYFIGQDVFWRKEEGAPLEPAKVRDLDYVEEEGKVYYSLTLSSGAIITSDGSDLMGTLVIEVDDDEMALSKADCNTLTFDLSRTSSDCKQVIDEEKKDQKELPCANQKENPMPNNVDKKQENSKENIGLLSDYKTAQISALSPCGKMHKVQCACLLM